MCTMYHYYSTSCAHDDAAPRPKWGEHGARPGRRLSKMAHLHSALRDIPTSVALNMCMTSPCEASLMTGPCQNPGCGLFRQCALVFGVPWSTLTWLEAQHSLHSDTVSPCGKDDGQQGVYSAATASFVARLLQVVREQWMVVKWSQQVAAGLP